jgi:hypothetical protein
LQLFLPGIPRYNRIVLKPHFHSRFTFVALLAALAWCAASCVAPLGPGYTVEKQQIQVHFVAAPEPRIRIEADYLLKNTGNQPLGGLELRLPGRRRFHYEELRAAWDGAALVIGTSEDNPRNSVVTFSPAWALSARHTLHFSYEFEPPRPGETALSFAPDAFFLPAHGWSPELLPPRGLFSAGGVPPAKWELRVHLPERFLVRTSGEKQRVSNSHGEMTVRAVQGRQDPHPFVIAGRYSSAQTGDGKEKVFFWTRKPQNSASLLPMSEALARTIEAYDAVFGSRGKDSSAMWIVECPVVAGCFTSFNSSIARIWNEDAIEPTTAEMISPEAMVVNLDQDTPKLAAAAAPSLAASWLGYAQNPGFYEQDPPLSALPAFAAAIGREAAEGVDSRVETVQRALRLIPEKGEARHAEEPNVVRAKSFLFFYALQDKYGREVFRNAVRHMLDARQERDLKLSDLIAAFEQETHQNVAEFVRLWMKHPGVPQEFRVRYERTGALAGEFAEESRP